MLYITLLKEYSYVYIVPVDFYVNKNCQSREIETRSSLVNLSVLLNIFRLFPRVDVVHC